MSDTVEWITRREYAEYLRLSPKTLANWASQGLGPKPVRRGNSVVYRAKEARAYADKMAEAA